MSKRMFSDTIVESDAFLEMPLTSQALYLHLGMNADNDGFVNPKRVVRMVGANEDDLKILIAKRFLLIFDSGVVVIKHWWINNMKRTDRHVPTAYQNELSLLGYNKAGAYTETSKAVKQIEAATKSRSKPAWLEKRQDAKRKSSLPDSFDYKIRNVFVGEVCPLCTNVMEPLNIKATDYVSSRSNPMPSIQHNTPLSLGGLHEIENISVVCQSCNYKTRNKPTGPLNNERVKELWDQIQKESATSRQPVVASMQFNAVHVQDNSVHGQSATQSADAATAGSNKFDKKSYAKSVKADEAQAKRAAAAKDRKGTTKTASELFGGSG